MFLEGHANQKVKSILMTGDEARNLAFHVCQAVTLVTIDFISSWKSAVVRAFDAPQISANKILLLQFHAFERYNLVPARFKISQARAFVRGAFYLFG